MKLHRTGMAALAFVFLLGACERGEHAEAQSEEEKTPPIPVETSAPVRGDIFAIYSGTAPIEAFADADVVAKVDGEVRDVLVEEGDDVQKGQILARLDGERLRLELKESQARLRKLQSDFQRNKELQERGLISEGDFEKLQYDLEALRASHNLASLELDYTQIRAPISGVVSERYIKLGNTIKVGDPIYRVTSYDPLVAYLHVPEREYGQLSAGQPVAIDIDAIPGERILASVTRVSSIVDPDTGTFKISIEIRDAERRVKPGMFGRVSIVYDKHENALQVPRSAVIDDMNTSNVFVVEENIAIRKPVQTGFSGKGMVEIISGIDDNDRIVTTGQVGLKDGARVDVIRDPADAAIDTPDEKSATDDVVADGGN